MGMSIEHSLYILSSPALFNLGQEAIEGGEGKTPTGLWVSVVCICSFLYSPNRFLLYPCIMQNPTCFVTFPGWFDSIRSVCILPKRSRFLQTCVLYPTACSYALVDGYLEKVIGRFDSWLSPFAPLSLCVALVLSFVSRFFPKWKKHQNLKRKTPISLVCPRSETIVWSRRVSSVAAVTTPSPASSRFDSRVFLFRVFGGIVFCFLRLICGGEVFWGRFMSCRPCAPSLLSHAVLTVCFFCQPQKRIQPEDVVINIGHDVPIPKVALVCSSVLRGLSCLAFPV